MFQVGKWVVAFALLASGATWIGLSLIAQDAKPPVPATPVTDAKDAKPIDLTALRDAVDTASKRGENVDGIKKALAAFEKVSSKIKPGTVPAELQALRDAVDDAARKGENVEAIAKELTAVEMAVAGKSLTKPRPQPQPDPGPGPELPFQPFPGLPPLPNAGPLPGGIDVELFNRSMELRRKALDLMVKNPRDPEAIKEQQKLLAEANELMMKAIRNMGGGRLAPMPPLFPNMGLIPDRVRLGIRMERIPALAVEQLGLEPNMGIAVSMVMPGSAAEKVGLKVHDIILEFAGKPVSDNLEDFVRRVNEVKVGEKVDIVVLRKGKKVEMKGVELPEAAKRPAPLVNPALPLPGLLPEQPGKQLPLPGVLPDLPVNPALPVNPLALAPKLTVRGLPAGFNNVNVTVQNGAFKLTATKGETKFTLTGATGADGGVTLENATIERDGKTQTADSLDKLTGDDRADVEKLLKTFNPRK